MARKLIARLHPKFASKIASKSSTKDIKSIEKVEEW
jgi:hypothetical protein